MVEVGQVVALVFAGARIIKRKWHSWRTNTKRFMVTVVFLFVYLRTE